MAFIMRMLSGRGLGIFVLLLLLSCRFSHGVESDINCLRSIKTTLEDPLGMLTSSWDFNNATEGFICHFLGIECWHPDESKVLNIKLADLGLKGHFPRGVANCTSLTGLDLSSNNLSGAIPDDIGPLVSYITSLDLSSNNFSGPIPRSISYCTHLNILKLDNNNLTGQIPAELGQLSRLKTFSVANNQLSGPIPNITNGSYEGNPGLCGSPLESCQGPIPNITNGSYEGNPGLCGAPLESCQAAAKKSNGVIVAVGAGGAIFAALVMIIGLF